MLTTVTVAPHPGADLLVPAGLNSPHALHLETEVAGGPVRLVTEETTGQQALVVRCEGPVTIRYRHGPGAMAYPEAMFEPRSSRFTRAAAPLAAEVAGMSLEAIVAHTAKQFTYGHPEARFNDGLTEVPMLCDIAEGSCVDINTYLIAALRAAGFEAGYLTGYFFPEEKGGRCDDAHCWVATRQGGEIQHWDIAHHKKMGADRIGPALDPKPGHRVAVAHSMGLTFPALGLRDLKLISEPMWITGGTLVPAELDIRCDTARAAA